VKHIIIIGTGPGISRSVAMRFGCNGYRVGLIARGEAGLRKLAAELAGKGVEVQMEVADAGDQGALAAALGALGPCDCLVYNASVLRTGGPLDVSPERLRAEFDVNTVGAIQAAQAVAPAMVARAAGAILFTGGGLALEPYPQWASLALGKAALRNYAFGLHKELAPLGVRVSVVTVCGIVSPGGLFDPDVIAAEYWRLAEGARRDGDREVLFAPAGSDPDYNAITGGSDV
jgi:short-subunit dehydrogenase